MKRDAGAATGGKRVTWMPDLSPLLCPRSIAVIGASTQPDKAGGVPIRLLRELGYAGPVYPVHVEAREIQGLRAYPTLIQVEGPVDLAIVAVPVRSAVQVMEQLAEKVYGPRSISHPASRKWTPRAWRRNRRWRSSRRPMT